MKLKESALAILLLASLPVNAANDVYGTVSEIITRSTTGHENLLYFRLNVMESNSSFESCVVDGNRLTWMLALSTNVTDFQYDIIKKSYIEQLPVRITGHNDVCINGNTDSDKIFELSPWGWDYHFKLRNK